jgi:hypothetical protein
MTVCIAAARGRSVVLASDRMFTLLGDTCERGRSGRCAASRHEKSPGQAMPELIRQLSDQPS